MSTKMPPVPPANRSDKGPGSAPHVPGRDETPKGEGRQSDSSQTGQEANTRINTTNQGYVQNR